MSEGTIRIRIDSTAAVQGERQVKGSLQEIRGAFHQTNKVVKESNTDFKAFGRTLVGALGVTGGLVAVVAEFRRTIEVGSRFQKTVSELSAITGAAGKDLEFLADAAKQIGRETTIGAAAAAEGFKLIASAKPDLLENRDALVAVTKEAITLAEAAGLTLPDAARALGGALNQFNADADQAGRFINVLAAGSQKGATEIPDLTESLKAAGTAAAAMNLSFETTIAGIEALGEVNLKGAEAGTSFRNVLIALKQTGIAELDPAVHGLAGSLENLNALQLDQNAIIDIFGRQSFVAAQALLDRTDRMRELEEAITDTNTAEEQAAIATDNLASDYVRLDNAIEAFRVTLFESAEPALRSFVQTAISAINTLGELSIALRNVFDSSAGVRDQLQAASLDVIDRRLQEEEAVLARMREANEGITGSVSAFIHDTSFGLLSNTSQDLVDQQEQVVAAIRAIRDERTALRNDLEQEDKKDAAASAGSRSDMDAAQIQSIRDRLLTGKRGKKESSGPTKEEREAQRIADAQARAYATLRGELIPLERVQGDLAKAQGVLNEEFRLGKIDADELAMLQGKLNESFADALDPLAATQRALEEQREVMNMSHADRQVEMQLRQQVEALKRQGVELTKEETAALRGQIEEITRLNERNQLRQSLEFALGGSQQLLQQSIPILTEMLQDQTITLDQYNQKLAELQLAALHAENSVEAGIERGFIRATQSMNDFAAVSEKMVMDTFRGMEDGIVRFAQTGKVEFGDLADSILADLIRIQTRAAMTKLFTGDNGGGGLMSFFGGGGASPGGGGGDMASQGMGFAMMALSAKTGGLSGMAALGGYGTGGIQNTPTVSKLAEKGPEAIVPLAGGAIPVKINDSARPAPTIHNVFHITTPDPNAFRRSQDAIALDMGRSMQRAMTRNG